jgi:hypothetical protein
MSFSGCYISKVQNELCNFSKPPLKQHQQRGDKGKGNFERSTEGEKKHTVIRMSRQQ